MASLWHDRSSPGSGRRDFWARARETPNWKDHPAADNFISLLCFADGAEVFKTKEYEFFLWHSLLSILGESTFVWDMTWLNFLVPSKRIPNKPAFYTAAMKYVAWQAQVLLSGVFPQRGFYDEEFPTTSWRYGMGVARAALPSACVVGWHGDCKARAEMNTLAANFNTKSMCD